jgi:hypothetical protein
MNNVPSAAAQIIVTIIPIVGIVMGCGVIFFYLLWSFKAKRALIERGLYKRPEFDLDTFSLFSGLVLTGIGAGLMIFFLIKTGFSYGILSGLIPMSCGVSLLVFFGIRSRVSKKNG